MVDGPPGFEATVYVRLTFLTVSAVAVICLAVSSLEAARTAVAIGREPASEAVSWTVDLGEAVSDEGKERLIEAAVKLNNPNLIALDIHREGLAFRRDEVTYVKRLVTNRLELASSCALDGEQEACAEALGVAVLPGYNGVFDDLAVARSPMYGGTSALRSRSAGDLRLLRDPNR